MGKSPILSALEAKQPDRADERVGSNANPRNARSTGGGPNHQRIQPSSATIDRTSSANATSMATRAVRFRIR